jgi:hypothetical protein
MKKLRKRKKSKKFTRITKHHIKNKCMGGGNELSNLLALNKQRHEAWHLLFHNLNLDEIISLLQRLKKVKDDIETAP